MDVRATTDDPPDTGADTIVVGDLRGQGRSARRRRRARSARSSSPARRPRSCARWPTCTPPGGAGSSSGCGERDEFDAERARIVAAVALGRARELGAKALCWELPHKVGDDVPGALVEGTLLAAYRYTAYKSEPGEDRAPDVARRLRAPRRRRRRRGRPRRRARPPTARATCGNAPANALTPEALAARARAHRRRAGRRAGPRRDRGRGHGRVRVRRPGSRRASRS